MNYLTKRRQFVQFDDIMSETLTISTGVQQGSILGPLLFTLNINDIHLAGNKFKATIPLLSDHSALSNAILIVICKAIILSAITLTLN